MKNPLQRRSEDSAARMIDAALRIAATDGLAAVTIARVAQESETSNGAIYYRYVNREGLLAACSDSLLSRIEQELMRALDQTTRIESDVKALRTIIDAHLNVFETHEGLLRAFMLEGRGEPELERRGYAASAMVGGKVTGWLVDRFGCTMRTADTIFRILFAMGTARLVLGDETGLTPYARSDADLRKDLLDLMLKALARAR